MSADSDILTGLADVLATAGIAVHRADGSAYVDGETAVFFGSPLDSSPRCVTLTAYGADADAPKQALSRRNVQVRSRGLPGQYLDAVDLDQAVFDALQGLQGVPLGSVWLIQCLRRSQVPMGVDAAYRWEVASNFVLDVNPPRTALRPE